MRKGFSPASLTARALAPPLSVSGSSVPTPADPPRTCPGTSLARRRALTGSGRRTTTASGGPTRCVPLAAVDTGRTDPAGPATRRPTHRPPQRLARGHRSARHLRIPVGRRRRARLTGRFPGLGRVRCASLVLHEPPSARRRRPPLSGSRRSLAARPAERPGPATPLVTYGAGRGPVLGRSHGLIVAVRTAY